MKYISEFKKTFVKILELKRIVTCYIIESFIRIEKLNGFFNDLNFIPCFRWEAS